MLFLARLLFYGTSGLALLLAGLVLVAPSLEGIPFAVEFWERVIRTFAEDGVVRRTGLAAAAGLLVTAIVFFRPALLRARAARARLRKSSSTDLAGA